MEAFQDFIASDAFFPVFIGLLILLVLIFLWILFSGNKSLKDEVKVKKIDDDTAENEIDAIIPANVPDVSIDEKIVDTNEEIKEETAADNIIAEEIMDDENNNPVFEDEIMEEKVDDYIAKEELMNDLNNDYIIKDEKLEATEDIISVMDESPVEIYVPEEEFDTGETIEVEKTTPLIEENVPEEEIIDDEIEMPMMKIKKEIPEDTVELPEAKELPIEIDDEAVSFDMPSEEHEIFAFTSIPSNDHDINDHIEIEKKEEFTGEKTEIFDFPDFSNVERDAYINNIIKES